MPRKRLKTIVRVRREGCARDLMDNFVNYVAKYRGNGWWEIELLDWRVDEVRDAAKRLGIPAYVMTEMR